MLFTISTWILLIKIRQYGNKLQLYLWVHISYDLMTVLKHCKELAISSCSVLTTKIKLMPKHNKQKLLCVGMFIYTFLSIHKIKQVIQILITLIQSTKRWWILYTLLGWMGNTCKTAVNWFFKIIHSFLLRIWINEFTACFLLYSNIYIAPHCHVGYQGKVCK